MKLSTPLELVSIWACLSRSVIALPVDPRQALGAVLSTIRDDPDLSIFYSLFKNTGSDDLPAPAFEERFNDPRTTLKYTVFAPVNEAFASYSPALLTQLSTPSSYEYLATILRNHIAHEQLTPQNFTPTQPHILVGGFSLTINPTLEITSNVNLVTSEVPLGPQSRILADPSTGAPVSLPAANGVVYKVDAVIDSFITYFGASALGSEAGIPSALHYAGTMADILRSEPDLSILSATYEDLDPDLLTRLELFSADGAARKEGAEGAAAAEERKKKGTVVYLAPSNEAWEVQPGTYSQRSTAAHNFGASVFLLNHGLGRYDEEEGVVRSVHGYNISVYGGNAENARVQRRIKGSNGEVWLLGRWINPVNFNGVEYNRL